MNEKDNYILINIHTILSMLWRRRYIILIPAIIMPFIGFDIGTNAQKYTTYTTILIQTSSSISKTLSDYSSNNSISNRSAAINALLKSRQVLSEVAKSLGLINSKTTEAEQFSIVTDLSSRLTMTVIGKDLIELKFWGRNADRTATYLSSIADIFIKNILEPSLYDDKGENFLKQQLKEVKNNLGTTKNNLEDILISNPDTGIDDKNKKIIDLRSKLNLLRSRYSDEHTEVQAALRGLHHLERGHVAPFKLSKNNKKSFENGSIKDIQHSLKIKRNLYNNLLSRYEHAQVRRNLMEFVAPDRIKIIDPPAIPLNPSSKPVGLYILAALFAGLCMGAALAYLLELLDSSIRLKSTIKDLTEAKVLCRLSSLDTY